MGLLLFALVVEPRHHERGSSSVLSRLGDGRANSNTAHTLISVHRTLSPSVAIAQTILGGDLPDWTTMHRWFLWWCLQQLQLSPRLISSAELTAGSLAVETPQVATGLYENTHDVIRICHIALVG